MDDDDDNANEDDDTEGVLLGDDDDDDDDEEDVFEIGSGMYIILINNYIRDGNIGSTIFNPDKIMIN